MRADAIVVLGCGVGPAGRLVAGSRRRVQRAAAAWGERVADHIVVSGGRRWNGACEADAFARGLEARGVPRKSIVFECCSLSTYDNAIYTARIARRRRWRRLAIVTCEWHVPRAMACFHALGVDAFALPAPAPSSSWAHRSFKRFRERASWWLAGRLDARWA